MNMAPWLRRGFALYMLLPITAGAFESDVHYGLTRWLAQQAGFTAQQARTIARGNQQVDSGTMDTMLPLLEYACLAPSSAMARLAGSYHFASGNGPSSSVSTPRSIVEGSQAARRKLVALQSESPAQAGAHLIKLGEALHVLQDSWAHAGEPQPPVFANAPSVQCDARLAWTHSAARGGPFSHGGDLAGNWPTDTHAMAQATYAALTAYPTVDGSQPRAPKPWQDLQKPLKDFTRARTKEAQRHWFASEGIEDGADFLQGTSLPDGAGFPQVLVTSPGRALPVLREDFSGQHSVPRELKDFFDTFFKTWLISPRPEQALGSKPTTAVQRELVARLKLWRLRDHGAVADLVHTDAMLTRSQLQRAEQLAKDTANYATYPSLREAVLPLLELTPRSTPLLPYIIHPLREATDDTPRQAIAIVKLRHAPYDELGVIAEKAGDHWRAVNLISVVSH